MMAKRWKFLTRQGPTALPARLEKLLRSRTTVSLSRLLAVVEGYPELKASRNFLSLQDQLEGTENRVAIERRSRSLPHVTTSPATGVSSAGGANTANRFSAAESTNTPTSSPGSSLTSVS